MHLCTLKKKNISVHVHFISHHMPWRNEEKNNHLDSSGCRLTSSIPTPSCNMQSSVTRRRLARGGFLMFFFRTDMLSGHASGGFEYTLWSSNMAGRSMKSEITATLVHFSTPTKHIKHWGSSSQICLQMNNTWNPLTRSSPKNIQRLNHYVSGIFRLNTHRIHVCYIYIYIYRNIYHPYTPNVSIYTIYIHIHGPYGIWIDIPVFNRFVSSTPDNSRTFLAFDVLFGHRSSDRVSSRWRCPLMITARLDPGIHSA